MRTQYQVLQHPLSRLTALPLSLSPHQHSLIELLLRTRHLQGTEDAPGKQTAPALMEFDSSAGRETPPKEGAAESEANASWDGLEQGPGMEVTPSDGGGGGRRVRQVSHHLCCSIFIHEMG